MSGSSEGKNQFLSVSAAPAVAQHSPYIAVPDELDVTAFRPGTCVEAYHVAQFAAEQYYRAVETSGQTIQAAASDPASSAIGTAAAWRRVMGRTMNGGKLQDGGAANAVGGLLGAFQAGKTAWQFVELQTLLPFAITGSAMGFAMALVFGPIFLLASLLTGVRAIGSWVAILLFLVFFVVFAQAIAVAGSFVMAGAAANQAAMASGWVGNGAAEDSLRAGISAVFGVLLVAAGWLAGKLTGISMDTVAGAARSAITTPGDAAATALKAATTLTAVGRLEKLASAPRAVRPTNVPHQPPVSGGGSPARSTSSNSLSNAALRERGFVFVPKRAIRTGSPAGASNSRAQDGFERLKPKT